MIEYFLGGGGERVVKEGILYTSATPDLRSGFATVCRNLLRKQCGLRVLESSVSGFKKGFKK